MEHISSHESKDTPKAPRLPIDELKKLILARFNTKEYMATTMSPHEVWNAIIASEILDLRVNYPYLAYRGSELGNNINFGLGGSQDISVPDAIHFDDAFLMAFMLMKDSYAKSGIEPPTDSEHSFWFKDPSIDTIGAIFDGIGQQQLAILDRYPDFAEALIVFSRLDLHAYQSDLTEPLAVLAAAEVYDAFNQMEGVRPNQ